MKEEKHNRVVAAITVNAVLFVFILIAIIIAQIVQISVLNRRKQELLNVSYAYEEELKNSNDLIERLENDDEFYRWFMQYVDVYGDEDPLNILPDGVIIK
ncbi:MAG: hypothetical protein ACI4VK_05145 [Candidatus Coproplasma sp.]